MRILIGEQRSNRFADEHSPVYPAVYVLHALVVCLDSRGDAGVMVNSLERAMRQKIQFYIIESIICKQVDVIIRSLANAWMRRVHCQTTVRGFEVAASFAQQHVAVTVGVRGSFNERIGGISGRSKPDERPEIYPGFLAKSMAVVNEALQLGRGEIVPKGIQIDIDRPAVLKSVGFKNGDNENNPPRVMALV